MPSQKQWPMPAWHESVPAEEKPAATIRLLLSLAAVYASEEGTASALADRLGLGKTAILQAKSRGRISPDLAVQLESLLGRDLFPRELFRPDLFVVEAE
jgi:hypothetical protein